MASLYHATGIVLSRRDRGEADRWYSVLTEEFGKIEVLARGGHKMLAKLTPHLEMPAVVNFHVVNGRQYDTLAGTNRVQSFPNIYGDLNRLVLIQNALHLTDLATRPNDPEQNFLKMVKSLLEVVDQATEITSERASFLLGSYALKLMSLIGYHPELSRCLSCKLTISPGSYRWHALKGGVVCHGCVDRDNEQWFAARLMSDEALKLVRFGLSEPFEAQMRPRLVADHHLEFHEAVESLMISHFPIIPANSLRAACTF